MPSLRTRLIAQLARIDQEIAETYSIGNDITLKMHDIFRVCEAVEGLQLARRKIEALLNGEEEECVDPMLDAEE